MKYISVFEPPSEKFIEVWAHKNGHHIFEQAEKIIHLIPPREDFFVISKKYPIFVVADGVTLIQYFIDKKLYPNPSPAGEVAKIFCEAVLKAAEDRYESWKESDIKEVFQVGNEVVGEFNRENGRTKETVDYWENDFYAATAALAVVKDDQVYWGSVCDSYVMRFDDKGSMIFQSPKCGSMAEALAPKFTGDPNDKKAGTQYTWRIKRNGVNERGERVGYGVVTGEPEALLYLASGKFEARKGDLVTILTDGFEDYMALPEFISLLIPPPTNLSII